MSTQEQTKSESPISRHCCGRYRTRALTCENSSPLVKQHEGAPSMSISMETNTAAIYLRRSTEDDGKSVGQQERTLRDKADDLSINIVAVYRDYEDEAVA